MKPKIILFFSLIICVMFSSISVNADENTEKIPTEYINLVNSMNDSEIYERENFLLDKYGYNQAFDYEDEMFIRALKIREEERTTPSIYATSKNYYFRPGPYSIIMGTDWYHFPRNIISVGYFGNFHFSQSHLTVGYLKFMSASIDFKTYGAIGDDGIGVIKNYQDRADFVIGSSSYYRTTFDTWSYAPIFKTSTNITVRVTDINTSYSHTLSIPTQ